MTTTRLREVVDAFLQAHDAAWRGALDLRICTGADAAGERFWLQEKLKGLQETERKSVDALRKLCATLDTESVHIAKISALIDAGDYVAARVAMSECPCDPHHDDMVRLDAMLGFLEMPFVSDKAETDRLHDEINRLRNALIRIIHVPAKDVQNIARDALEGR